MDNPTCARTSDALHVSHSRPAALTGSAHILSEYSHIFFPFFDPSVQVSVAIVNPVQYMSSPRIFYRTGSARLFANNQGSFDRELRLIWPFTQIFHLRLQFASSCYQSPDWWLCHRQPISDFSQEVCSDLVQLSLLSVLIIPRAASQLPLGDQYHNRTGRHNLWMGTQPVKPGGSTPAVVARTVCVIFFC